MRIGLVDVDGRNFPNLVLMKLSAWHKFRGDTVEFADPVAGRYDKVYLSKVFTHTPDCRDEYRLSLIHILNGVGFQRVDNVRFADFEGKVVAVFDHGILLDHFDQVAPRGVCKGQHRGYIVFQRIERRHIVTAAVQPYDRSRKCDVHRLAFAFGRYFLRVVIADLLTAFDDGIQPHALRIGVLDETLESPLLGSRIGLEDPHVLVELPIVAILHAAEQPAPDTDLLKRHEAVRLVEHGCYGHAPAVALQPVSYTHLDVYKRQTGIRPADSSNFFSIPARNFPATTDRGRSDSSIWPDRAGRCPAVSSPAP